MQMAFFRVPVNDDGSAANELNRFLHDHRIDHVQREFIADGENSAWAVCVAYGSGADPKGRASKKPAVDYREVLSPEDFAIYARLRSKRKEISQAEGIPAFSVFTNEQLAAMVTGRVSSLSAMAEIDGIGEARISKYGEAMLALLGAREEGG